MTLPRLSLALLCCVSLTGCDWTNYDNLFGLNKQKAPVSTASLYVAPPENVESPLGETAVSVESEVVAVAEEPAVEPPAPPPEPVCEHTTHVWRYGVYDDCTGQLLYMLPDPEQ